VWESKCDDNPAGANGKEIYNKRGCGYDEFQ